jgi:hypothetical protein
LAVEAREFEDAGTKPSDKFMRKMGENHLLSMNIGPSQALHGLTLPGGLKGEDFDYFHEVSIFSKIEIPVIPLKLRALHLN